MSQSTNGETEERDEIMRWILQLGNGDQEAARLLWAEYFGKLTRLARRKLEGMPRRDIDEEDVALSAMHSFYRGIAENRFDALAGRDDLWKLLVTITARKATARLRRHYAQKRGGGGVRGESIFGNDPDNDRAGGIGAVLGREPTPELAEGVAESCRELLDRLEDDTLRQIALMTLEGYRTDEIAVKLGCVRRTVERKLERIRVMWGDDREAGKVME